MMKTLAICSNGIRLGPATAFVGVEYAWLDLASIDEIVSSPSIGGSSSLGISGTL
jgi:hypothetical protein